jgi:hypothetical protein
MEAGPEPRASALSQPGRAPAGPDTQAQAGNRDSAFGELLSGPGPSAVAPAGGNGSRPLEEGTRLGSWHLPGVRDSKSAY